MFIFVNNFYNLLIYNKIQIVNFFLQFIKSTNCETPYFFVEQSLLFAPEERKMNVTFGVCFEVHDQRVCRYDGRIDML